MPDNNMGYGAGGAVGGIYPNDVATLALLGRGVGYPGYGYGYGGGYGPGAAGQSVLAAQAHADGTGIGTRLEALSDAQTETRISDRFQTISDNQFRNTLNVTDRLTANQIDALRTAADIRQQLADCCCETQKEIAALGNQQNMQHAATLAAIADLKTSNIQRDLLAAQARVTQLETINAITQACGCCGNGAIVPAVAARGLA